MDLATTLTSPDVDAFYTLDRSRLARTTERFVQAFPGRVLYAVKANPLPEVVETVLSHGIHGFDIASLPEARLVRRVTPTAPLWFMNPVKSRRDLALAWSDLHIRDYVIDSEAELEKLLEVLPTHDAAIRVWVRFQLSTSDAVYELNSKFGASMPLTARLLARLALETRWRQGLAFHPGSQTMTVEPYLAALQMAEQLICEAQAVEAVDIGGGFPGLYANLPPVTPWPMLDAVGAFVSGSSSLRSRELVCEPGRSLTHDCMSLFARVLLRSDTAVYCGAGIFNGLLPAQQHLQLPVATWRGTRRLPMTAKDDLREFTVFGPTCDSMDRLAHPYALPDAIEEGDWIEFQAVGAYSESVRCTFNGFSVDHRVLLPEGGTACAD
ncbi:alanine racemase [Roseateles sp. SL47]|uniref:alanine racemase n=1 Tax=Roseateles sp. SL47 TaxID=2995138 RepID=UPI002271A9E1|nr:alanine racemase [Roseateles sp. SL47]WAC71680.1 alanine racemase [Roseateles sp. SL47]